MSRGKERVPLEVLRPTLFSRIVFLLVPLGYLPTVIIAIEGRESNGWIVSLCALAMVFGVWIAVRGWNLAVELSSDEMRIIGFSVLAE